MVNSGNKMMAVNQADFTNPADVERRVWRNIFIVLTVGVLVSAIFARLNFTLGTVLGGALALFNYKWLHASLRGIMGVGSEKTPPGTTMKFIFRWFVIGAVIYAASQTGRFDSAAMLAALFAPAVAIMIEAFYVTFKTIAQDHGER